MKGWVRDTGTFRAYNSPGLCGFAVCLCVSPDCPVASGGDGKRGRFACGRDEDRTKEFRLRATPFLLAEKKWGKETARGTIP